MTPEKIEETLNSNGYEIETCYADCDRRLSLRYYGGALSDGVVIIFTVSNTCPIPIMEVQTFDSEVVELNHEVAEAIAYCILNFDAIWEYYYYENRFRK